MKQRNKRFSICKLIIVFFVFSVEIGFSQINKDSLQSLIEKSELYYSKNLDSSLVMGNNALQLSLLQKDSSQIANSHRVLAVANFYKQNYDLAEQHALKSIQYSGVLDKALRFKIQCYQVLAGVKRRQGNFNESLSYYNKTLEINEDPIREAGIKVDMGTLYIENGEKNLKAAFIILKEALEIYNNNANKIKAFQYVLVYDGLSKVTTNFKESLYYSNKSIAYAKKITSGRKNIFLSRSYSSKAFIYSKHGYYKEAIYNFNKVLAIAKKIKHGDIITTTYKDLASVSYKNKLYENALSYLDSITLTQKRLKIENFYDGRIDSLRFSLYSKLNKFKEANIYAKKTIVYLDSVSKEKNKEAYLEFGRKYESEIKAKENKILKQEISIKELTLLKEARYKSYLYLALFLTLLLLLYGNYRYRKNVRTKNVLTEKNTIIELQKEDLQKALNYSKQINEKLGISNNTKEKLFGVIAHDLINPFNTLIGYTNLLLEDFEQFTEEEKIEIVKVINEASKKNHILVKNLLDWSRSQQNRIVVNNEELTINTLIDNAITPYLEYAKKKNIKIIYDFEFTHLYADQNILKTVIGNLFFNAVKFTKANHNIFISSKVTNEIKTIEIKDEGVGMCKEKLKTLFHLNTSNTTKGTNNEKGSGLGLIISKEFLELAGGNLKIQSKANFGTSVSLEFA
ncbi:tetratricopeptide repeat-containing sensor histidine kinase [Polaribacter aestuariivivens]|uniref:tetratricopeptide repeat-containing sensor histidine kinase n=1 Tax=Polaribacter aestuariivivens TaxID=2304626 RepID=UPI003F4950BA